MSGESFSRPTLAQRATLALSGGDEGARRIAWADLVNLDTESVAAFQTALQLEAERRHLELKVYTVTGATFDGIEVRWRPARG